MYLKRVDIKGFKSFAESTTIHFEPGINVVVGPNGCGKSNVVDAVRWVLGENNIRNLRGQKGEDIIFCGTDSKRAHGMATVEMLIDNGDGFLPLEYEELNLTRKLFRSGESEFSINRTRVRMKDIHDLLAGTGLGKKGYAIISQGELEQLLNAQSLDRRLILEEASGIIKYRQQREEVKRRLDGTAQDLTRLTDLLFELRQRSEELQHKAEKAQQYLEYKGQMEELEKILLAFDISRLEKERAARQSDLAEHSQTLSIRQEQCLICEEQIRKLEMEMDRLRLQEQKALQDQFDAEAHIAELRSALELTRERINNYQERVKAVQADAVKYSALLTKMERDLLFNREDYAQQQALCEELEEQCRQIIDVTCSLEQSISREAELFEAHKAQLFADTQEQSRVRNSIQEEEDNLHKSREKRVRLDTQREQLQQQIRQATEQKSQLLQEQAVLRLRLENLQGQIEVVEEAKTGTAQQLAEIENRIRQQQQQLSQQSSRLDSLKSMRESLSGYAPGVKAVIKWGQRGELAGILGIVGELLEVPPGLETAIEIAAGRSLENIVVKSSQDARQAIERLKMQRSGRVTFLPLDSLRYRQVPEEVLKKALDIEGVIGSADRLVQCLPQYRVVLEYLLGRILVVQNLHSGMRAFKQLSYPWTLVSLEGEVINASGAMTGGFAAERGPSRLQRRAEEKRVEKQLLKLQEQAHQLEQACGLARSDWEELNQKALDLKNDYMEHSLKSEWLEKQVEILNGDLPEYQLQYEQIGAEIGLLEQEAETIQRTMATLHDHWQALQHQQDSDSRQLENQKEALTRMRQNMEVYRERSLSHHEQLEMRKRELENSHKNLLQFEAVQKSYQQSCQEAKELLARLEKENESESQKMSILEQQISAQSLLLKSRRDDLAMLKSSGEDAGNRMQELRESLLPMREKIQGLEQGIRNHELHLARLEVELSNLHIQWQQRHGAAQSAQIDVRGIKGTDLRQMKQRLGMLKEEMETLGAVDIGAIEESQALQDKLGFIEQQFRDLEQARSALLDLLKDTERLMVRDFKQFMIQANQSFAQTFKQMFNGGEGRLITEAGTGSLEMGVDIEVKIPGKRVQSLHLLSGGERALTCIAFLFALIRLKPVPFCLLDEIDASLDETNLLRFTAFLQGMSQETQFIVITHRQTTIECGNTIYGVTMAEKGISGVYTLALEEVPHKAG